LLRLIAAAAAMAGIALAAFGLCRSLWLGLVLVYLVGAGQMFVAASTNTVLQSIVPDALRARVASLYVMSFLGVAPLGAFVGGWVAERIGPPLTLVAGGALAVLAAALYLRRLPAIRRDIRPLYRELGIIAEREAQ
ncbi:MAG: MFS transporter, partial [Burkholderiales bacterium]|nr:MFS transporter [Burkholderiales bacterium]